MPSKAAAQTYPFRPHQDYPNPWRLLEDLEFRLHNLLKGWKHLNLVMPLNNIVDWVSIKGMSCGVNVNSG